MSGLLNQLEQTCGSYSFIDVEMNTLEDAYINIAKEEERLMANLQVPQNFNINEQDESNS